MNVKKNTFIKCFLMIAIITVFLNARISVVAYPKPPSQEELDRWERMGDENLEKYGDGGVTNIESAPPPPTPKAIVVTIAPTLLPTVAPTQITLPTVAPSIMDSFDGAIAPESISDQEADECENITCEKESLSQTTKTMIIHFLFGYFFTNLFV